MPIFWLLQSNVPQAKACLDVSEFIVQMQNMGVRMMGGNMKMIFSAFLMPIGNVNATNA